jgi:hypothetical protein
MPENQQLNSYEVTVGGLTTTMRLTERDAKRLGGKPKSKPRPVVTETKASPDTKAHQPANKSHTPEHKEQ